MNQLILGDCLEVMKKMDSESVDLIYQDIYIRKEKQSLEAIELIKIKVNGVVERGLR